MENVERRIHRQACTGIRRLASLMGLIFVLGHEAQGGKPSEVLIDLVEAREEALSGLAVTYKSWNAENEDFTPEDKIPHFRYRVRFLLQDDLVLQYMDRQQSQQEGYGMRVVHAMDTDKGYSVFYDARQATIQETDGVLIDGTSESFRRVTCFMFAPYRLSALLRSDSKVLAETAETITIEVSSPKKLNMAPDYRITFDRAKGFAVRAVEASVGDNTLFTATVTDFTQTDNGVWIPQSIKERISSRYIETRAEEVQIKPETTAKDFIPEIPQGFGVTDEIQGIKYDTKLSDKMTGAMIDDMLIIAKSTETNEPVNATEKTSAHSPEESTAPSQPNIQTQSAVVLKRQENLSTLVVGIVLAAILSVAIVAMLFGKWRKRGGNS
jgi:hypothetical protein